MPVKNYFFSKGLLGQDLDRKKYPKSKQNKETQTHFQYFVLLLYKAVYTMTSVNEMSFAILIGRSRTLAARKSRQKFRCIYT